MKKEEKDEAIKTNEITALFLNKEIIQLEKVFDFNKLPKNKKDYSLTENNIYAKIDANTINFNNFDL